MTEAGPTLYYHGRYLYSSRAPQAAPVKLAAKTTLLSNTLYFIPSFGLGYGIAKLLERLPEDCHVLCVERDESLMALGRDTVGKAGWLSDDRFTLVRADATDCVNAFFAGHATSLFRRCVTLPLCAGSRLYAGFYREVEEALKTEIRNYWQNKITMLHMGSLYVKNLFTNCMLICRTRDLATLREELSIIVAGAGPSLFLNLELIRKNAGRAALLAVDTALPVLLEAGIHPDYVFALEPQFINIGDFIKRATKPFTLIADISSSPQVIRFCLEKLGNRVCLVTSRFAELSLLDRLETGQLLPFPIPPLGSVGIAAVYVALTMTRSPVILTGLDFSYPWRKTHSRGAPVPNAELAHAKRTAPVGQVEFAYLCARNRISLNAKNGRPVETDIVLSAYSQNLQALCKQNPRIFDINPQGLPTGAPFLRDEKALDDILQTHSPVNETVAPPPGGFAPTHERLHRFLADERLLIREGIRVVTTLLDADQRAIKPRNPDENDIVMESDTRVLLQKIAHTACHLPINLAAPRLSGSSLAQILYFLRYFAARIDRILKGVLHGSAGDARPPD